MENQKQSVGSSIKKVTSNSVFKWIVGSLFLLVGITSVFSNFLSGLCSIVIAFLILPPVTSFLKKRYNFGLSRNLKIVIVVLLLVFIGTLSNSGYVPTASTESKLSDNTSETKPKETKKELDLKVWYRPTQKGFTIPVFEVRNESDTHWSSCKVSLNDSTYKTEMSDILTVSEFKESLPDSYGSHYIMSNKFTKKDGTMFNPYTVAPQTVCVLCNEPNYAVNCWSFN
jgi:hypothetical protein